MGIKIHNAYENNLKNLSVEIPIGKMTAVTGVSGSGKSSLLKNVLAAVGARKYSCTQSSTIRSALEISNFAKVEDVLNLPETIFIDTKNTITTSNSTVSTVSGVHELLRNLFLEFGECYCPFCGKKIDIINSFYPVSFVTDITCDERYSDFLSRIKAYGQIVKEIFYDQNKKKLVKKGRTARFAEVYFEITDCSDRIIEKIDKDFRCIIFANGPERYDPIKQVLCTNCVKAVPRLTRGRISFLTPFDEGGGMCRKCHGSGQKTGTSINSFICDGKKTFLEGAINFVSDKGIKYTSINESIIKSFARNEGIDLKKKVQDLTSDELKKLMYGDEKIQSIGIGKGKKKTILFRGVIGELKESFLKGKGTEKLSKYFEKETCPACRGTRLDEEIRGLRLHGKPLEFFLQMTIAEFHEWCQEIYHEININARPYLERLLHRLENFCRVSCGHLSMDRSSNTLSGGELQRIRVCALLNASVNNICYLLDEPSSGLHELDIEALGLLLKEICNRGNTIIMVEHNRKLLNFCDWIVEIGPQGGNNGGRLVFSDQLENISKYESPTAKLLSNELNIVSNLPPIKYDKFLCFDHIRENNLKDLTISIPYGAFTVICGISGSGKSTLLRQVLWERIGKNVENYGFTGAVYLAQRNTTIPYTSTIATQIDCFSLLVKFFSKASKIPSDFFLPNSNKGKCLACSGRGILFSAENEPLGTCHLCGGKRYNPDILKVSVDGYQFGDLMMAPLTEIGKFFNSETVIRFSEVADLLGIGYLSLSRRTATLSKGEFQRLKIANAIAQNVSEQLFLLDEPSNGLHSVDAINLVTAIRKLTVNGNTVVTVEHNPTVIQRSDYIVELGGRGENGGQLLYCGSARKYTEKEPSTALTVKPSTILGQRGQFKSNSDCVYEIEGKNCVYPSNEIHDVRNLQDQFNNIATMANSDLLSVSMPGNSFYSRTKYYKEHIINSPVFLCVDFSIKKKYNFSLYDVLGLRDAYTKDVIQRNKEDLEQIRFIFDDKSLTGKCRFCRGLGTVDTIDEKLFLDGSYLSKGTQMFLKKSLSFATVSQILKNSLGFTLSDEIDNKNKLVWEILFYGYEAGEHSIKCEENCEWPGLINFFLRNHAYYPGEESNIIFASHHKTKCPVCAGMMLKKDYLKYSSCEDLTYQDLMQKPMTVIMERLSGKLEYQYANLKRQLKYAINLGLGKLCAGERLSELSEIETGLVCLSSMMGNGIYGTALLISHLDVLAPVQKEKVMIAIEYLRKTNTIFIG